MQDSKWLNFVVITWINKKKLQTNKNALQRQGESDFKQEMSVINEYQSKANLQMESRWSWVYTMYTECT